VLFSGLGSDQSWRLLGDTNDRQRVGQWYGHLPLIGIEVPD